MNGHYAAAGNKVARLSLYEVGRAALDSHISARRMNPYSLAGQTRRAGLHVKKSSLPNTGHKGNGEMLWVK
jgi:hypothetical protein